MVAFLAPALFSLTPPAVVATMTSLARLAPTVGVLGYMGTKLFYDEGPQIGEPYFDIQDPIVIDPIPDIPLTSQLLGVWVPVDYDISSTPPSLNPHKFNDLEDYDNTMKFLTSSDSDSVLSNIADLIIKDLSFKMADQLTIDGHNPNNAIPDLSSIVGLKSGILDNLKKTAKSGSSGGSAPPANVSAKKAADTAAKAADNTDPDNTKKVIVSTDVCFPIEICQTTMQILTPLITGAIAYFAKPSVTTKEDLKELLDTYFLVPPKVEGAAVQNLAQSFDNVKINITAFSESDGENG